MNYFIQFKRVPLYFSFTFLSIGALDLPETSAQNLVDIRPVIVSSENKLYENGTTRIEATRVDSYGKVNIVAYYARNAKSEKLSRIETTNPLEKKSSTRVQLNRPDGKWTLLLSVAICEPDNINNEFGLENLFDRNNEPVSGVIEEFDENDKKIRRISWCAPDDLIADIKYKITNYIQKNQMDAVAKSKQEMENMIKQIMMNAPYKYVHEINKETGYTKSKRIFTKEGKQISEVTYLEIKPRADVTMAIFEIPKEAKLLMPNNLSEYMETLRRYSDTSTNKTK